VTPLHGARAAIAGAVTMILGVWVLFINQAEQGFTAQDAVFAVVAFLAIILLLLGVDIRRRGGGKEGNDR
jgi:membrane-bound ClpP family serine protease